MKNLFTCIHPTWGKDLFHLHISMLAYLVKYLTGELNNAFQPFFLEFRSLDFYSRNFPLGLKLLELINPTTTHQFQVNFSGP